MREHGHFTSTWRRGLAALLLLCLWAAPVGAYEVIGGPWPPAASGPTIWEQQTWEANPSPWYSVFDAYDNAPADFSVDGTSKVVGTYSLKLASSGSNPCYGAWTFSQTEFYYQVKVYISSTGAPETGDSIYLTSTDCAGGLNAPAALILYYDTDHYEVNCVYRNDGSGGLYVGDGGANTLISDGVTVTADAVHTITFHVLLAAGTGSVGYKVDEGSWLDQTVDNDTRTFTQFRVFKDAIAGTVEAGDFLLFLDNLLLQNQNPSP